MHFPLPSDEEEEEEADSERRYDMHHRMRLDVMENLSAVDSRDDWRLMGFDYKKRTNDNDSDDCNNPQSSWEWRSASPEGGGGENVQAFEEKFN